MTDLRKVRSLVEIMKENPDFTDIAVESSEGKIQISREMQGQPVMMQQPFLPSAGQPNVEVSALQPKASEPEKVIEEGTAVEAPCVGTYYGSPKPDSPAFVKVGDRVKKGQTVCIVEAMKNMNSIGAPCDGVISAIVAINTQPVEFGQVLMRIV